MMSGNNELSELNGITERRLDEKPKVLHSFQFGFLAVIREHYGNLEYQLAYTEALKQLSLDDVLEAYQTFAP